MKKRMKQSFLLLCTLLSLMLLAACGEKDTAVTVNLVNRSGQAISELYITPATTDEWGNTLLVSPLEDGDMQQIGLGTFTKEDLDAGFNILIYNTQNELLYNTDLDEQIYSIADRDYLVFLPPNGETELDITAKYDSSKYDTLAAPAGSDPLLGYVGSWKYDSLPAYLVIDEAGNWYIQNLYGKQEQSGTVTLSDGTADLYLADSSYYNSLALADELTLADGDGNVLLYTGDMPLLPSSADTLDQTATFPEGFTNVAISYASTLTAQSNAAGTLTFTPAMGEGTDDCYSGLLFSFQPISGYDEQMTKGLGTAQPQLEAMLQQILGNLYGDKLLGTTDVQCMDWGTYYSVTGNISVAGSAVSENLADPLSGTVEIRYHGPTGYALTTVALAPAHRIDTYSALRQSMLGTCTYTNDWATAPKAAPETPASPADGSDPGDANTPYYWYDEDGDIWYWDGEKNEFIGFGNDYYIDDDGNYYESNDAGWDPDAWSDPGDYGDDYYYDDYWYDDDDYYDDYDDYYYDEYYDDGWGDDF